MRGSKKRLLLERKTENVDSSGCVVGAWIPIRPLKGTFYTVSGDESLQYGKISEVVTHRFITKIVEGETILQSDRFRNMESGSQYEIKQIDKMDDRAHWWQIRLKQYDAVIAD
jgi:hypothetical protein